MKVQVENGTAVCPECNIPIAIGYDPDEGPPQSVEVYHTDEDHIVDRPSEEEPTEEATPAGEGEATSEEATPAGEGEATSEEASAGEGEATSEEASAGEGAAAPTE